MDGDIERCQLLLVQSLPVKLLQVGQRNEVAKEERVAVIVILDIERGAHTVRQARLRRVAFGQPFDEAEDAFIGALANKGRRLLAKEDAQAFIITFGNRDFMLLLLAFKANRQRLVGGIKAKIDEIADEVSIDRAN